MTWEEAISYAEGLSFTNQSAVTSQFLQLCSTSDLSVLDEFLAEKGTDRGISGVCVNVYFFVGSSLSSSVFENLQQQLKLALVTRNLPSCI